MVYPTRAIFKFLIGITLLIILVVLARSALTAFHAPSSDLLVSVTAPVRAVGNALRHIIPFAGLREENARLRERLAAISRRMTELRVISAENDRLNELLNFRKTIPYKTIPAQVIGRDPSNWAHSLIVDKGSLQGVMYNKAVISPRGLVGRTIEVGRVSSKILLLTDPNSKVGVMVMRNQQGGIAVGRPDGNCKMIYIALESDIRPGDIVVTAGFSSVFPKGVPVGVVVSVDKEPGRLYKYAIIRPAQDLSKLQEVLCLR